MFICNYGNFGSAEAEAILYGTPTLTIGWQELTPKQHKFYKSKNEVYNRKVSSKRSYRKLKQQILDFLISIHFKLLMYIKYSRTTISNQINSKIPNLKTRIINVILNILKIALLGFKSRLKRSVLGVKSSVKARLPKSLSGAILIIEHLSKTGIKSSN
jgi:hypothetical protein